VPAPTRRLPDWMTRREPAPGSPIPFEAANGGNTRQGCALATGQGARDGPLAALRRGLAAKTRASFDSDFWDKRGLHDLTYGLQRLSLSYIGVTPDPGNIMPKPEL